MTKEQVGLELVQKVFREPSTIRATEVIELSVKKVTVVKLCEDCRKPFKIEKCLQTSARYLKGHAGAQTMYGLQKNPPQAQR